MKVQFLGPPSQTLAYLIRVEKEVEWTETPGPIDADIAVSHGYRYILPVDVVETVPVVNLHISYLPWNRGAHPNYWAIREGTPSGVTIHYMDAGIDTGPIIAQRQVPIRDDDTLRTSYDRLQREVFDLFRHFWPKIRNGDAPSHPQPEGGSAHTTYELPGGVDWDMPVKHVVEVIA